MPIASHKTHTRNLPADSSVELGMPFPREVLVQHQFQDDQTLEIYLWPLAVLQRGNDLLPC